MSNEKFIYGKGKMFKRPEVGETVTLEQYIALYDAFDDYLQSQRPEEQASPSQDGELQGIRRRLWLDVFKGANAEKASEAVKEFDKTFF